MLESLDGDLGPIYKDCKVWNRHLKTNSGVFIICLNNLTKRNNIDVNRLKCPRFKRF